MLQVLDMLPALVEAEVEALVAQGEWVGAAALLAPGTVSVHSARRSFLLGVTLSALDDDIGAADSLVRAAAAGEPRAACLLASFSACRLLSLAAMPAQLPPGASLKHWSAQLAAALPAEQRRAALSWFEAQSKTGHSWGKVAYAAVMLWDGRGIGSSGEAQANAEHLLSAAADRGDKRAQFALAELPREGSDGSMQQREESALLYRFSAGQGYAPAQHQLALGYARGDTGSADPAAAAKLWGMAAQQGHPGAMYHLAMALEEGRGLPRDAAGASRLYGGAAAAGHLGALVALGTCLEHGGPGDLAPDPAAAVALFRRGVEAGSAAAAVCLGRCYWRGAGVAARDPAEAVRLYRLAAEQGSPRAQCCLAAAYQQGVGVPAADPAQAVSLLRAAAVTGYTVAMTDLGWCLEHGHGIDVDLDEAARLYAAAAAKGSARAQFHLALLHQEGRGGVPRDAEAAAQLLEAAAKGGHPPAWTTLGLAYERGAGVCADVERAVECYASAPDEPAAQYRLAHCLELGRGVPEPDVARAAELYRSAAGAGYSLAQWRLGCCLEAGRGVSKVSKHPLVAGEGPSMQCTAATKCGVLDGHARVCASWG